jgi:uncharacterized membrane protein YphA (DoxX/SURF4 family)
MCNAVKKLSNFALLTPWDLAPIFNTDMNNRNRNSFLIIWFIFIVVTALFAYFAFFTAFVFACVVLLSGKPNGYSWLFECVKYLFVLQAALYCVRILSLPFPKSHLLSVISFSGFIGCDSIYSGSFTAYCLIRLVMTQRANKFEFFLFPKVPVLYKLLRYSNSGVFLYSSIASMFFYQRSLHFFTVSGYTPTFFNCILIMELVCGIGLLFGRTALCCSLFLLCDMAGAIYTHYHNYLISHIPDPLGNSIPALIILSPLSGVIVIALKPNLLR